MNPHYSEPIEILLVEDSPADAGLTVEALKTAKIANNLSIAEDGEEAMDFLYRRGKHAKAPRPDLILLDLNLPRKDGREVLREIKTDPSLKRIPVVVLTTSKDERDVMGSYEAFANCYITKPVGFEQFMSVVQSVEGFWLAVVTLPPDDQEGLRPR
jgi:two-component system, chemotaxis family, response regulator Rcp1